MKLLYTCPDRADDPLHWSGTVWHCRHALSAAGIELAVLDRIPFECPLSLRLLHQAYKRLRLRTHHLQYEPAILRRAAARIATRFAEGDCDAVFSPGTGVPVAAYLPASVPVISYLDATKRSWIETYFGLRTLCARSRRHLAAVDLGGLINHALTVFSSDWARQEAAGAYQMPTDRMAVVPFGANLSDPPSRIEVELWIAARRHAAPRLLFLGKDWKRKGGPEALALTRALRALGRPATLDIVGCSPELDPGERAYVRVQGFIPHATSAGAARFRTLLSEAQVLLFFSRAEAYGIALCEAAAHGVPAYALRVGGIPTILRHGVTGWLDEAPFEVGRAAATLDAAWRDPDAFAQIALAARAAYEARLNWNVAGRSLRRHIEHRLAPLAA